jgi:hypothetical protein
VSPTRVTSAHQAAAGTSESSVAESETEIQAKAQNRTWADQEQTGRMDWSTCPSPANLGDAQSCDALLNSHQRARNGECF